MKLYTGKLRIYKKIIRTRMYYNFLIYASHIKPGDIVTTCEGYNKIVTAIKPCIDHYRSCTYVSDIDIVFTDKSVCSALACCTFPALSKTEIIEGFKETYKRTDPVRWNSWSKIAWSDTICYKVGNGLPAFDDRGCPIGCRELHDE